MQSFLQYRQLGRQARAQYQRQKDLRTYARGVEDEQVVDDSFSSAVQARDREQSDATRIGETPTSQENPEKEAEEDLEAERAAEPRPEGPANAVYEGGECEGRIDDEESPEGGDVEKRTTAGSVGRVLTGVKARRKTTYEGRGVDRSEVFVVGFHDEDDKLNPHNWSYLKRIWVVMNIAMIGWIVGFASSIDSAALPQASQEYGVSEVAESLATALFLIAFGCGGLVAGPLSEEFGRNPVYITTLFVSRLSLCTTHEQATNRVRSYI